MSIRTTERSVIFERPFRLGGIDGILPAGTYKIETEEALLEGVSFDAYRRLSTRIYLRNLAGHPGLTQIVTIKLGDLDAALERDRASAAATAGPSEVPPAPPRERPRRPADAERQAEERADNEGMPIRGPSRAPTGK